MGNIFSTKKFKSLNAKWAKKLASSGFEDAEYADGSLKKSTDVRAVKFALQEKEQRQTYYSIAADFLNTHEFNNPIEKTIWDMHCEGISRANTAKALKVTFYKVESTIITLRKLAKLRKPE